MPDLLAGKKASEIGLEAARLRRLGYSLDQAYTMAEIMLLLRDAGFLAMTSDDYEHLLEGEHAV